MKTAYTSTAYCWFDTEYTGLDLDKARLLQVALVLTDSDCKRLAPSSEDINLFVRLPEDQPVSPWIVENVPSLVTACRGPAALDVAEVDARLAAYVSAHVTVPGGESKRRPILAGNSVHNDWFLMRRFLPRFASLLHYRHLDVTALKLQWQDWFRGAEFEKDRPDLLRQYFPDACLPEADQRHDAYYDAQASIAELNYYRQHLT